MDFFTSDNHFGHSNIIGYCNRPFSSVEKMNETMIERWNAVVTPVDRVFHIGDFGFGSVPFLTGVLQRLNGVIVLIRGNHDRKLSVFRSAGCEIHTYQTLRIDGFDVFMKHKPMFETDYWAGGQLHLCGHVHTFWASRKVADDRIIYNVGVDVRNFTPVTLQQILEQ